MVRKDILLVLLVLVMSTIPFNSSWLIIMARNVDIALQVL